ncbi:MAG: hypothetical protein ACK4YP_07815, partial [Myxococcota bacterium]
TWIVTWHGFAGVDGSGSLARGIAWGSSLDALTRRSAPILTSTPGTWTDVGIGRADLRHEDGYWYMVYEGLSGSALCIGGVTWTGWGIARSTDLVSWTEHPDNPVALDTDSGCGEDMPAFQVVDDRVMVVTTRPDTDGVHRYALAPTDRRGIALSADGTGWWIASRRGTTYDFGAAAGLAAAGLPGDLVGIAALPDGTGAWAVDGAGVVDALGAASHLGDLDGTTLNAPVVGIAATPSGNGYWLVAADGGVFCFGDALFYGSMGGETMNAPVVGMAATPGGTGYWLVGADGGVFTFGDAGYHGSAADLSLAAPIVGIAGTPSGAGYRLVGAVGGVFAYGDATYLGGGAGTSVGIASAPAGAGYVVLGADGTTWTYGGQPDLGDARTRSSTR